MKLIGRLILAAFFLALTGALIYTATQAPDYVFLWYPAFSRAVLSKLATLTAPIPFAVWELLLGLILIFSFYTLVRAIRKAHFLRWLSGLIAALSIAVFLFVALWGLNHFGPTLSESVGYGSKTHTVEELTAATAYFAEKSSEWAPQVRRDENNRYAPASFDFLAAHAGDGYAVLAESFDRFSGSTVRAKRLISGKLFNYLGITGLSVPYTGEVCVNPDTYPASLPFVMCHEMAHRLGAAAEEDADFCAFLACLANGAPDFRYSGYYSAFLCCYNALFEADPNAATNVWDALSPTMREECEGAESHYRPYEGALQDAAQSVNDAYLKSFSQERGILSYEDVSSNLVSWYVQNIA